METVRCSYWSYRQIEVYKALSVSEATFKAGYLDGLSLNPIEACLSHLGQIRK